MRNKDTILLENAYQETYTKERNSILEKNENELVNHIYDLTENAFLDDKVKFDIFDRLIRVMEEIKRSYPNGVKPYGGSGNNKTKEALTKLFNPQGFGE
jgi:hypothetical protein